MKSVFAGVAAALTLLVGAPSASATTYGVVMPGNLPAGHPTANAVDDLAKAGARTAKIFVTWDAIEPRDGAFDKGALASFAQTARHLHGQGVATTVVFFGGEAWLTADPAVRQRTPPADPARFAAAAAQLASTLDGLGVSITVWNEADETVFWRTAPEPARYVELLRTTYAAVKAAAPSTRVLFTPLTSGNWRFLQAAYDAGAKGHFDAIGVDADTACSLVSPYEYYRDQQDPDRVGQITFLGYREVRKTLLANGDGDKPIQLEIGWSTSTALCNQGLEDGKKPGGVSEEDQARFLREAAHCIKEDPYLETAFWFEAVDRDPTDTPDHRFGLLRSDHTPKPSYQAFLDVLQGIDTITGPCGDFQAPAITVESPVPGQKYADRLDVRARATDPSNVLRVTFEWGPGNEIRNFTGEDVGNDRLVGLTPWVRSSDLPLGQHTIRVIAVDRYGNRGVVDVPVEKVAPDALPATFTAVFRIGRKVACRKRVCRFRVSVGKPAGTPTPAPSVNGKVLAQWQWYSPPKPRKEGVRRKAIPGKWKTLHKARKPANKVFTLQQKVRRAGRWRLRLTHEALTPYRRTVAKDIPFRIR